MEDSNITIKGGSGTYNFLDKIYNNFIITSLKNIDEETEERWVTYETVIRELVALGKANYFEEIKYRLTGGEDPNDVILDILNKDAEVKTYLWPHVRRIQEYKGIDLLNRFLY